MDSKDWRNYTDAQRKEEEALTIRKYYGRRFDDYIGEKIREAEARGEFDNLQGAGQPLRLLENIYAGDKSLSYHLLKSNGYAPQELELAKEIRAERERVEAKVAKIRHQGQHLRSRRVPPFPSEKRAFNITVEKTAAEYERVLRELNRKILTLNLSTPVLMHQTPLPVEQLLQQFRDDCPLFN